MVSPLEAIVNDQVNLHMRYLDPMIFRFKISQFPFHTPFDSQFLPVSLPFSHFSHQNNASFI